MTNGIEKTLELLAKTKNEAATDLLLQTLDVEFEEAREPVLRTLMQRKDRYAQQALLGRWEGLPERSKSIIATKGHRLIHAVRDAVLSGETQAAQSGYDAVLWIREFDLVPALITAAEDQANPLAPVAGETLLSLCDMLFHDLAAPRDYREKRDPQLLRSFVLSSLDRSVRRFDHHQRLEIIECFLMLSQRGSPTLRRILQNPHDSSYLQTVDLLTSSPRPGVQELVLDYLQEPYCPTTIHQVISHRTDLSFIRRLLRHLTGELSRPIRSNLKRIESFCWLKETPSLVRAFHGPEQVGAVQLATLSGMNRTQAFCILDAILQDGCVEGRRLAAAALNRFQGVEANQRVLNCLDDTDAEVQANAAAQLRDRGIPGAMQKLLELSDSPYSCVRDAVKDSLAEFSFDRYLRTFDLLDDESAEKTGQLVKRIDAQACEQLAQELLSRSRNRKQRGLAMAAAMNAVEEVENEVIGLLEGDDHALRTEAARCLALCRTPRTQHALRELLVDRNPAVQEAAQEALHFLTCGPTESIASEELCS